MTTSPAPPAQDHRPRTEVLADAVISAYVHEISGRHRPPSPAQQPAQDPGSGS